MGNEVQKWQPLKFSRDRFFGVKVGRDFYPIAGAVACVAAPVAVAAAAPAVAAAAPVATSVGSVAATSAAFAAAQGADGASIVKSAVIGGASAGVGAVAGAMATVPQQVAIQATGNAALAAVVDGNPLSAAAGAVAGAIVSNTIPAVAVVPAPPGSSTTAATAAAATAAIQALPAACASSAVAAAVDGKDPVKAMGPAVAASALSAATTTIMSSSSSPEKTTSKSCATPAKVATEPTTSTAADADAADNRAPPKAAASAPEQVAQPRPEFEPFVRAGNLSSTDGRNAIIPGEIGSLAPSPSPGVMSFPSPSAVAPASASESSVAVQFGHKIDQHIGHCVATRTVHGISVSDSAAAGSVKMTVTQNGRLSATAQDVYVGPNVIGFTRCNDSGACTRVAAGASNIYDGGAVATLTKTTPDPVQPGITHMISTEQHFNTNGCLRDPAQGAVVIIGTGMLVGPAVAAAAVVTPTVLIPAH